MYNRNMNIDQSFVPLSLNNRRNSQNYQETDIFFDVSYSYSEN